MPWGPSRSDARRGRTRCADPRAGRGNSLTDERRPRPVVAVLLLAGALLAAAAVVTGWPMAGRIGRWIFIAGAIAYAVRRRSLTTWILVSMIVGGGLATTGRRGGGGCASPTSCSCGW